MVWIKDKRHKWNVDDGNYLIWHNDNGEQKNNQRIYVYDT